LFARFWAPVCLIVVAPYAGWSEAIVPTDRPLVVFLKVGKNQSSKSIPYFRHEVSALMHSAGYRVEWRELGKSSADAGGAAVAVVDLLGMCDIRPGNATPPSSEGSSSHLATTAVSDGRILPFSSIDCGTLSSMLAPILAVQNPDLQDYLYGRAMARVAAHELYHVLSKDHGHAEDGVAKPAFATSDLLANRFVFASAALERLLETESGPEAESGR
jgi:hypothetical protein